MEKQAFEPTGLVPRSIIRTIERFRQQLMPGTEAIAIQEFRISRYQVLVSLKCLATLIFAPLFVNLLAKTFVLAPTIEHFWNLHQDEIFLNSYQEDRALLEMHNFSERVFFESLLTDERYGMGQDDVDGLSNPFCEANSVVSSTCRRRESEKQFQQRGTQLAIAYNRESLQSIINLVGDCITFLTVLLLFIWMKPQIIILKSFLTESIYSLSDTSKSFLLILCTDLLVGFHSPRGWEIAIESLLRHFGLPENQDFIFLFVAAFPVFLDTIFKYWIFRYLNKISPSTVATYHNMIE